MSEDWQLMEYVWVVMWRGHFRDEGEEIHVFDKIFSTYAKALTYRSEQKHPEQYLIFHTRVD